MASIDLSDTTAETDSNAASNVAHTESNRSKTEISSLSEDLLKTRGNRVIRNKTFGLSRYLTCTSPW